MNNCNIIGNLTKTPEIRTTQNGKQVCQFTLAVYRDKEHTDFINCVAWNKSAELLHNYCKKGDKIGVSGSLQVRSYENSQGYKVYVTEVLVDRIDLLTPRNENTQRYEQSNTNTYQANNNATNAQKSAYFEEENTFEFGSEDLPF